ncbi:MAG: hypothetical protein RBT38_08855 [Bacteroidales bacterium]|jgi:hypothetical protein|nr:hypothetical protein [Bacteroidales bacterium]
MKNPIKCALLLLLFTTASVKGQTQGEITVNDTQDVKVTLFDSDDIMEISLAFDISHYKKYKSKDEYLDAVLTYYNSPSDSVVKNIKVRARGNIRRTAICDFPPLMLNFRMQDSEGSEFSGINKLKIVPYCKIGYEDYILREYLVYRLYNVVTDYSYRVRLFRITYINTARTQKNITQYAFAIEPTGLLAKRTGTVEIEYTGNTQRTLNPDMLDMAAVFNYMIGNTDWSVPINHNVQLLFQPQATGNEANLIIPYDFDYAGIVHTNYAVPFESLPIENVRQRLYMAVCRDENSLNDVLRMLQGKKQELYKVIEDFPYLHPRSKKDMISYLNEFFAGTEKKNPVLRSILTDCRWFEEQSNLRVR